MIPVKRNPRFTYEDGISLREYFEVLIGNIKEATEQARVGMEKRLDGMNEFRDTLRDQASKFITRDEVDLQIDTFRSYYENQHKTLEDRIENLEQLKSRQEGAEAKSNIIANRALIVSVIIGVLVVLLTLANILILSFK